ncbi:MAG TPA: hypothetical protein VMB51_09100, partial [Solirubrobacteraceae bacterium]|nr:hypothetical protein [Solirubrobacteraceae bacterium]
MFACELGGGYRLAVAPNAVVEKREQPLGELDNDALARGERFLSNGFDQGPSLLTSAKSSKPHRTGGHDRAAGRSAERIGLRDRLLSAGKV